MEHPAPVEQPTTSAKANAQTEVNPSFGVARFNNSGGPREIVTEKNPDGSISTSLVGRRSRLVEPPTKYEPKTFNPYSVDMDDFMALRKQGYVPKVEVVGDHQTTNKEPFDLPAWLAWRAATSPKTETPKAEIELLREARSRGYVPPQYRSVETPKE